MRNFISWSIVVVVGLGLMLFSYYEYQYEDSSNPWKEAFMYIGKTEPGGRAQELGFVKRPIRLLAVDKQTEAFSPIARSFGPGVEKSYRLRFQDNVILYSGMADDFTDEMIKWGRFPDQNAGEVIAGAYAKNKEEVTVEGRVFKIVGQFKKEVALFSNSYLAGPGPLSQETFSPQDSDLEYAYIFHLAKEQLKNSQIREKFLEAFPKDEFTVFAPMVRTEAGPFYLYVGGVSLVFLGGSFLLFRLYVFLAGKIRSRWLSLPLAEIGRYKYLFGSIHVIYFGLVLLFMLTAYQLPQLQVSLLAGVSSQVADGSGPLGIAGKAYMSGNILRAALVTFVINFLLGSLASITIPSIIIPGAGILIACFRAGMWGLLLGPGYIALSGVMLPHSFTLLLEGHAYILATFFGLLVPIYLFRKAEGLNVGARYGKALMMNVRANLLVVIVLAVAAIYEAIEVILMSG